MDIFIINLKDCVDRKRAMIDKIVFLAQQSNYTVSLESKVIIDRSSCISFNFIFFDAVDSKNLSSHNVVDNYNPLMAKLIRGKLLSNNEIACFASHYKLWQHCANSNRSIVILEDDVNFEGIFFETIIAICSSGLDYVRLMYLYDKSIKHVGGNFYIGYGNLSGTQGYFLTPNGASRFISKSTSWFHCVDNYMDMFFINHVPNIVYKPFCIEEDTRYSRISSIKDAISDKPCGIYKLTREFFRIIFDIYKYLYVLLRLRGSNAPRSFKY